MNNRIKKIISLILTINFSTNIVGLADGYKRNTKLIPTPITIPNSTPTIRHKTNVANVGIKSFLLERHIGLTTSYSIMNITAHIITAAKDAFGM